MVEPDAVTGALETPPAPVASPWLSRGTHLHPDDGYCLVEWASQRAGLPFDDRPRCTHTLVAEVARIVNDALDDHTRQQLADRAERLTHAGPATTAQTSTAIVAAVAHEAVRAGIVSHRISRAAASRSTPLRPAALAAVRDKLYRYGTGRRLIVHIANAVNRLAEPSRSHTLVALLDAALDAATAPPRPVDPAPARTAASP